MDTSSPAWLPLLALLALELTLVVGLALALQPALKTFLARRTLWQATLASLALLTIAEVTGVGRGAWGQTMRLFEKKNVVETAVVLTSLETPQAASLERVETVAPPIAFRVEPVVPVENAVWWPGILWLAGVVLFTGRPAAARMLFAWLQRRRQVVVTDSVLLARVRSLATRMGLRQTLRVTYTNGLTGPIAFGFFRPCISLPIAFAQKYSPTQQEAMLAHELAHLAAHDPAWQLLADLVTALLWWHPLAWWARRQLRATCEAAADEASLLIEDGPHALAECLVTLGGHLVRPGSFGGLGIEGDSYRSGLGQRVKRLLSLKGQCWRPRRRGLSRMVIIAGPTILVMGVLAGTSWVQPLETKSESSLQSFQKSVIGLAWSTVLQVNASGPEQTAPATAPAVGSIESEKIDWQPWSPEALTEARAQGQPVLVCFTADWSLTAQFNQRALNVPSVREKLRILGAVALRADNTKSNEFTAILHLYGGEVPFTQIYSPDTNAAPQILPSSLTPELVLQALDQAMQMPSRPVETTKGAESKKNDAPALILQAKTLLDAGKTAEADAKLKEALALDPANKAAAHFLALAGAQHAGTSTPKAAGVYRGVTLTESDRSLAGATPPKADGVPPPADVQLVGKSFATNALSSDSPAPLSTRWFKVDPTTMGTNLRDLLGTNAVVSKGTSAQDLALTNFRRLLDANGVELSPPKQIFFNDRSGLLMVRASLAELDIVEQLVQMLNVTPPQVTLEVRFCEVTEEDGKKLGFDWFLGNQFGPNANVGSISPIAWPSSLPSWDSRSVGDEPNGNTVTGILTDPQFRVVLRALENRRGMNVITAPKVTTLSGRQAQIKTVEIRYIVTDLDFNTNATPPAPGVSVESSSVGIQPIAKPFELGPVIDLVPRVAADGFTIQLTVIATIKEFLRYENKEGFVASLRSGKSEPQTSPTPLPTFRLRQVVTSAVVWDGQTLVLSSGSMISEAGPEKTGAGATGQKGAARLLRSNAATRQTKSLLVFVTPTIIDPAGNRVHSPDDLPMRKNSIPPQKPAR